MYLYIYPYAGAGGSGSGMIAVAAKNSKDALTAIKAEKPHLDTKEIMANLSLIPVNVAYDFWVDNPEYEG